jgi:hypothetical protein
MPAGQVQVKERPITCSSREEFIADIQLTTPNTSVQLPTNGGLIPNDRFLYGMRFQIELRITNNAGPNNPTGTTADAPYSIIDNLRIEGYHRIRQQRERFVDARLSDLRELNRIYSSNSPYSSVPSTGLNLAANATNDIRFIVDLPFTPQNLSIHQQIGYLLDAPNYDQLQLTLAYADDRSVFTGGTAGVISAFGSSTGTPRVRVSGLFALAGPNKFTGYEPARTWRWFQEVRSGDIITGNTNSRLFNNVPKGYRLRAGLFKTGTISATSSSGNNVYATLNPNILTNLRFMQGINRPLRYYTDFFALGAESQNWYSIAPTAGYGLLDFAPRGHLWEALDTSSLIAGASGDTDLFVQTDIAGAAAQSALILYEEIRGRPKRH